MKKDRNHILARKSGTSCLNHRFKTNLTMCAPRTGVTVYKAQGLQSLWETLILKELKGVEARGRRKRGRFRILWLSPSSWLGG